MPAWPDGKRFAFTIVDDTDFATVENVAPVYDLLVEHGILTTKTVWPIAFSQQPLYGGETLEDPRYAAWVLELRDRGVEIALHGATDHPSLRGDVIRALDVFREVLGEDPRLHVNHFGQKEGMYWGDARLDGLARSGYRAINAVLRRSERYLGHVEGSPYFWGDVCKDRITYVRNFVYGEIDTLACDPLMPYHDPRRPHVNFWFSSSEAPEYPQFASLLRDENIDRLVAAGGACIVYTHLACGFARSGGVEPGFARIVERLASLPGWYVPASTLLDHLRSRPGWQATPDRSSLARLQRRWLAGKLRRGRK